MAGASTCPTRLRVVSKLALFWHLFLLRDALDPGWQIGNADLVFFLGSVWIRDLQWISIVSHY